MGKKLYITEKPSVALSFATVLGFNISKSDRANGYAESSDAVVSWCFGHLINLAYPAKYDGKYKEWKIEHLPIIPNDYIYEVIEEQYIKKQFEIIKALLTRDDIDLIYCCTDSGREGEYIYRLVYMASKSTKPAKRVWISSQTEEAIKNGISKAKDIEDYNFLANAAYCRAKEDWLFGINFSRIYTCQYGWKLSNFLGSTKSTSISIGRVMTCVLGLVVNREEEIKNFVTKIHYGVSASFTSQTSNISYIGKWQIQKAENTKENEQENDDKYISKEDAQAIIDKLNNAKAKILKVEIKSKNEQPPLLFNLAELQSEANKKFKLPVDRTLEIAQTLYEKKLITYPRTDCRVLSTDIVGEIPKILNGLYKNSVFKDFITKIKENGPISVTKKSKRFVDDSKVTDHYAIVPTYMTAELDKLETDVKNIYYLIVKRFLAIFYSPALYNTVKVETDVSGELFITNSKSLKSPGWKEIYEVSNKNDEELSDSPIHNLKKNELCDVHEFTLDEKETKPASRYTDGSLILTMEKAGKFIENEDLREQIKTTGIGTSATRSSIIKKLKEIGYMQINPKTQVVSPTILGESIVAIIKITAKELLNPSLTASWEKGLSMIENRETTSEIFYEKLCSYITKTIDKVKQSSKVLNIEKILIDKVKKNT